MLDSELEVAPGYPQPTARDWLVCREPQANSAGSGAGVDGEAGAHARPGQHDRSRSEDGYEVCSCTSLASPAPGASGLLLATALLLPPSILWTLAQALAL